MSRFKGLRARLRALTHRGIEELTADVRYALRALRRTPAFTAAAIVTLALGLGANAAIFTFLNDVFLQPPSGVVAANALRRFWLQRSAGTSHTPYVAQSLSYHEYRGLAAALGDRVQLALYATRADVPLGRDSGATSATVAYTTASYFPVLGARPTLGRAFTDAEADVQAPSPVAVISDALWHSRFGGDPTVLGRPLSIDAHEYTIIGVAPARFRGIDLDAVDLWLPLGTFPTHDVGNVPFWDSDRSIAFSTFGRLMPAASDHAVEALATTSYRQAEAGESGRPPNLLRRVFLRSIIEARGPGSQPRDVSIALRLGIVALLVLLIAGANVVNLLLARTAGRRREIAVRLALGIGRARLVRLFVVESVLLSLAAGMAALLSAQITGALLRTLLLPTTRFAENPLRWHVAVATVALALVAGIVAGLIPALQASRPDLTRSLKAGAGDGATGRLLVPKILVGAQAALSVALLTSAALFIRSLVNVEHLHIGFDVPRLAYASVQFPAGARPDSDEFASRMRAAGERLRSVPGIETIAFARDEPMQWFGAMPLYTATDSSDAGDGPVPTASVVSADYFKAVGLSFIQGSDFTDTEIASTSSVVINQALARLFWPDRSAIGQCLHLRRRAGACRTVVGVVGNAIRTQLIEAPTPQLYLPMFDAGRAVRPPDVVVLRADPRRLPAVAMATRSALRHAFPHGEPIVVRMADRLAPQYRPWQLGASLFSVFGALALAVAAFGIYSAVSYSVAQRRHELGVRIALGASARDVMRHVVGLGIRPVLGGALAGALLTIAGGRLIASLLYGIEPWNVTIVVAVIGSLLVTGAMAAALPGWRATRIDPVRALSVD